MNIVEVKGLSKSFNQNKVLDNVDFVIEKGSFTALLGKNGSGKSTILNILMGDEKLDKGECLLFGESLRNNPDHLKNKIGHVSEKIRFDYPMTMNKFIPEYGKLFTNFDTDKFFKLAKDVNINLDKQFGEYSRGQKMQVVLMAALAQNAELLLIDEITSVLDAFARSYFITLLKEYTNQGGTVVLTTNIVNEIQFYSSHLIFLSKSNIKFQTALKDIPANFKKFRSFTEDHPVLKSEGCIWSGINSDGSSSYIIPQGNLVNANMEGLLEDRRVVTLEDLYIYYSQRDHNE